MSTSTEPFDPRSVQDLVRLRGMLEHALRLARDTTAWGRHTALIALDGVCEYSLWLSAQHLGVALKPSSQFHELLNGVANSLKAWDQAGRRGVLQLRNARNQAQHGGTLPDPALMPEWRDDTGEFVRGLARAAYGRDLDRVVYADALEDPELRDHIADAESALAAGRYSAGIEDAVRALYAGRARWLTQRDQAEGVLPYSGIWLPEAGVPDLNDDTSDVAIFADDLSEYVWLKAFRFHVAQGVPAAREDAERALAFAYRWLLRWQAFDRNYPLDRWRAAFDAREPPQTDSDTPEIVEVSVDAAQTIGTTTYRRLTLSVANIPNRGRSDWDVPMTAASRTVATRHGLEPWTLIVGERVPAEGRFVVFVDPNLAPATISAIVTDLVAETTSLFGARKRPAAERQRILALVRESVDAAMEPAASLFGPSRAELTVDEDGDAAWVQIPVDASDRIVGEIGAIFRGCGGLLAPTTSTEDTIGFRSPLEGVASARELLADAARRSVEYTERQIEHAREQEAQTEALVAALAENARWEVVDGVRADPTK